MILFTFLPQKSGFLPQKSLTGEIDGKIKSFGWFFGQFLIGNCIFCSRWYFLLHFTHVLTGSADLIAKFYFGASVWFWHHICSIEWLKHGDHKNVSPKIWKTLFNWFNVSFLDINPHFLVLDCWWPKEMNASLSNIHYLPELLSFSGVFVLQGVSDETYVHYVIKYSPDLGSVISN